MTKHIIEVTKQFDPGFIYTDFQTYSAVRQKGFTDRWVYGGMQGDGVMFMEGNLHALTVHYRDVLWVKDLEVETPSMSEAGMYVGDEVEKVGGDYIFRGHIVSKFLKRSGAERFVVEDDRGVLHVYSEKNLRLLRPGRVQSIAQGSR